MTMKVNLHIERLVLEGLPITALQGTRVQTAMECELVRMLVDGGLPKQWRAGGAVPHMPEQQFGLTPNEPPEAIGQHIARSVHRGIGGDASKC